MSKHVVVLLCLVANGALRAADCNGNGTLDATDTANGTSLDCNANSIPDECEGAPLPYRSQERIAVDGIVREVLLRDFDGDDLADLAISFAGGISIHLNDGDRDFVSAPPETHYFDGESRQLRVGDLDHDGDLDLASADHTGILILHNQGDGTFDEPVPFPHVIKVRMVELGDLNRDGAADFVVRQTGRDEVTVSLSRDDGGFEDPEDYPVGRVPHKLAVGDVDGDGDLDVAVANRRSFDLSILLNQGDGSFEAAESVPFGEIPQQLILDDFNSDGRSEIAVAGIGFLQVLQRRGVEDDYVEIASFSTENRIPTLLVSHDIDGDGAPDLIGGFVEDAVVFRNDGAGRFNSVLSVNLGFNPVFIALDDLDADGEEDLVVCPAASDVVVIFWADDNTEGSILAFQTPATYPAGGEPHTAALGDIDRDGDLDLVTGNNNDGTISVLVNDGNGAFEAMVPFRSAYSAFSVVVDDFDQYGHLDLAAAAESADQLSVYPKLGSETFSQAVDSYNVGRGPFHVTAGDLNGDLAPDLITSNRGARTISILLNSGDGKFTREDATVGNGPIASTIADLDGDQALDIAVANEGSSDLSILLNQGTGGFSAAVPLPIENRPNFIVSGDFDSDGDVDLATTAGLSTSGGVSIENVVLFLWNDGSGTFDEVKKIPSRTLPYSATTADMDGNSFLDIILISEGRGNIVTLLNNGDRSFVPLVSRAGDGPRYVVVGDLERDGDVDIIGANRVSEDITVHLSRMSTSLQKLYLEHLCTEADFFGMSVPSRQLQLRATKYVTPAHEGPARDGSELLPTVFQNVNLVNLHQEFLTAAFPELFPSLSRVEFDNLVGRRASRDYFIGTLERIRTRDGVEYTFTVVANTASDPGELLMVDEVATVHAKLSEAFELRPLSYRPDTDMEKRQAATWVNPSFPIFSGELDSGIEFEAYTVGVGYGRVRLLTLEEFNERNNAGQFTFQDIVVVSEAPRDIEGVVGGVITGAIQGPLSHIAIRTARRGTPNAFVADALEKFSPYADELVRLEVFSGEYFVTIVEPEEAAEFWATNRPETPELPGLDMEYGELDHLFTMDLGEATGISPTARFGGKTTNLARLQRVLNGDYAQYREVGFGIPLRYYIEFMDNNTVTLDDTATLDGRVVSYRDYIQELISDPEVQSNSQRRFEALQGFRDLARSEGVVDPALVAMLAERIEQVFGSTDLMVRFRSSSNVEDALVFNGAGLYESTSVCAADTLDAAIVDGSFCDPSREDERTIERALKKVWSSLWTFRAHEERTFFQIPTTDAAMGVLVNRAFLDEAANGVAFTGNPSNSRDRRYLITVQAGEASVVSPDPGTSVERNFLEMENGKVVRIFRERSSSLFPPGESVMSDDQLAELGALMEHVDETFPLDLEGHARDQVLLDFEFKIESDGTLAVKQVRPFLIPDSLPKSPTFELVIPADTVVCGVFSHTAPGRKPANEYEHKSMVKLLAGRLELPGDSDTFSGDLIDEVVFGASQEHAQPVDRGLFRVTRISGSASQTTYRFDYEQDFMLPDGEILRLEILVLNYLGRGEVAIDESLVLDEEYVTFDLTMQGLIVGEPVVTYSSCGYQMLPRWDIAVELNDGSSVSLQERFLPSESNLATGPAAIVQGSVRLGATSQTVRDYWRLVYSAHRHNLDVRYWLVLDPALDVAGLERPVNVVEVFASDSTDNPATVAVSFLDEDFALLRETAVDSFAKSELSRELSFHRGDVDASGDLNINDATALLGHLFEGAQAPSCRKAADANDDGTVNVSDVIGILQHLFAGQGALPEPQVCGADPTPDRLTCEVELCG